MPFLPMDWTEEQKQQGLNVSGSGADGGAFSKGSAGIGTKSSGSWVNLNKYLDANKEQGQGIGEKVAGTVGQSGQEAKDAISQSRNEFKDKSEAGYLRNADTAKTEGASIVYNASNAQDPSKINTGGFSKKITPGGSSSDKDKERWKEITTAQYKGPERYDQLDSFTGTNKKISDLNNNLGNLDTEEGRGILLSKTFKNDGYSYGERGLDNMLMSGNEMSKNALSKVKDKNKSVESDWKLAQEQGAADATQKKGVLDDLRAWSKKIIQDAAEKKEKEADISSAAGKNKVDMVAKNIKDYQEGKAELSPETLRYMNIVDSTQIFNVDPSQFLGSSDPRLAISKDQAIQLNALGELQSLAGITPVTKYETNSSKVGGDVFDEKGFKEATSQAAKDYEVAYNNDPAIEFQGKLKTPASVKTSIDSFRSLLGNPNYVQDSLIRDINYLESQLSNWMQSKGYTNFIGSPAHIAGVPSRLLGGK